MHMEDCPSDFQITYLHYLESFGELRAFCKDCPDGSWESFFTGHGNYLLGELDGGITRYTKQANKGIGPVIDAWHEVRRASRRSMA